MNMFGTGARNNDALLNIFKAAIQAKNTSEAKFLVIQELNNINTIGCITPHDGDLTPEQGANLKRLRENDFNNDDEFFVALARHFSEEQQKPSRPSN